MRFFIPATFLFISFLYIWRKTKKIDVSLLSISLLSSITTIGSTNINVLFIILSIFIGVYTRFLYIPKKSFFLLIVVWTILSILISLSVFNGGYYYNVIGKSLKLFIICFLLSTKYRGIDAYDLIVIARGFIGASVCSLPFMLKFGLYDNGFLIYRFSGYFFDANFFSLICLFFLMIIPLYTNKYSLLLYLLFLSILLSQSWSTIILYFIIKLIGLKRLGIIGRKVNRILPFLFFLLTILIANVIIDNYSDVLGGYQDYENYYVQKMNSAILRYNIIVHGYLMIMTSDIGLWTGFGSGKTFELFGKVFHNLYFQDFFDHGICYFIIFYLYLAHLLRKSSLVLHGILLILLIQNFFFDNLYTFVFSFIFLLYSAVCSNKIRM